MSNFLTVLRSTPVSFSYSDFLVRDGLSLFAKSLYENFELSLFTIISLFVLNCSLMDLINLSILAFPLIGHLFGTRNDLSTVFLQNSLNRLLLKRVAGYVLIGFNVSCLAITLGELGIIKNLAFKLFEYLSIL